MSNKIEEKKCLIEILNENLIIPNYQRPYEWNKSNVYVLLNDIYSNYKKNRTINLGVIILNKNNNNLEVVDGQQRLITLSLLLKVLDDSFNIKLLDSKIFCLLTTENRIIKSFKAINVFIERLINFEKVDKQKFFEFLKKSINFYILETKDTNEAFQLFDGRNSKYKELTPVDLLKAYHLGALPKDYSKEEKKKILEDWNRNIKDKFKIDDSINKIEYLYNNVLFNIYNWSLNKDIRKFTKNDIYLYKGFKESDDYTYVKYYTNISNSKYRFQINKPFKAGKDFFDMTNYYIEKLDKIIKEKKHLYKKDEYTYNWKFINYLYYGALLFFYDKFGEKIQSYYKSAIDEFIYNYSILHRVKNKLVNFATINSYVLNARYNFFFECSNALNAVELLKLELDEIGNQPNKDEKLGEMRNELWNELKQ